MNIKSMKKCAFTICTKSYCGIAKTVRDSFIKHHSDFDFYIVFVDGNMDGSAFLEADTILEKYLSKEEMFSMKFQYDLTEYCTSVKPFLCKHFIEEGNEVVVYIDPDILFYSKLEELYDNRFNVYVTPHVLTLNATPEENESNLRCGVFNCGFIAFRISNETNDFLDWWGKMLKTSCFDDSKRGLYTDQKWSNFVPVYFDMASCCIVKRMGCNVAPWNFFEREIVLENNKYYVVERKSKKQKDELCFVHYSGFNYKILASTGQVTHGFRNIEYYNDLNCLFDIYANELKSHDINAYLSIPYRYNFFTNGEAIHPFQRRLYEARKNDFAGDPFDINNDFYKRLCKRKLLVHRDENVSYNIRSVGNLSKKEKMLVVFFKMCKNILGIRKYTELLKGLALYSRAEKQTWLLDK